MKYIVLDFSDHNMHHEFDTEAEVIEFAKSLPADDDQPNKVIETFKQATDHIQYGMFGNKNLSYRIEKTIEEKLADIRAENEAKLLKQERCLRFEYKLMELLGIDFMVTEHHDQDLHAWVELDGGYNKPNKFDRSKLQEYYNKLLAAGFEPERRDIKPIGKEYNSYAPAHIKFHNHFSELCIAHTQMAEVVFHFKGHSVSFKFPAYNSFHDVTSHCDTLPEQGNKKHPLRKDKFYMLDFGKLNWYGGDYTIYADTEAKVESFMNVIWNHPKPQATEE